MTTETLTKLLAWSTTINVGLLVFATVMLIAMRGSITKIHGSMFGLSETDLSREYFRYLANYKIAVVMLNLVPYLALRIIAH